MADQIIHQQPRVTDDDGVPVPGAKINVYATGTLTRVDTYEDAAATTIQTNPVIADANGFFGQMFTLTSGVRLVVTDADDVTLYDIDPAPVTLATDAAAGAISFTPTSDVPYSNVQAAVEGVSTDLRALLRAVGWNITDTSSPATSTILADLDATTLATGAYRFGNETTGTYPTGVSATDKGEVLILRGPSDSAVMTIWLDNKDLIYTRRMAAAVWLDWHEIAMIVGPWAVGDIIYRQSGAWKSRAIGSAGEVLAVNDAATAPAWVGSTVLTGQTITSGSLYTLTHNLGRKGRHTTIEIVCTTGEHGYSVGHIVEVLPIGCAIRKTINTTEVTLTNDATVFAGAHRTTGAPVDFTNANWTMTITTF